MAKLFRPRYIWIFFVILVIVCITIQHSRRRNDPPLSCLDSFRIPEGSNKTILFWNEFFSKKDYYFGEGQEPFIANKCKYTNCFATSDKCLMPIENFDAVIFHGRNSWDPPPKRESHQRYVYYLLEAPTHISRIKHEGFFNWTMTYRWDSDVPQPYGFLTSPESQVLRNFSYVTSPPDTFQSVVTKTKTKLVGWFVSNCKTQSHREEYVTELSKYVPVDVYGKCGTLQCPSSKQSKCFEMLEESYKFYLSFENSLCIDYVTEKLFNILKLNIVPVVLGAANYKDILPPMSYIDVRNFASPKKLAEYLLFLDKNDNEYKKYFWWKSMYVIMLPPIYGFCKLCEMLNMNLPPKNYDNLDVWFRDGMCSDSI